MTPAQIDQLAEAVFVSNAASDMMIPALEARNRFQHHREQRSQRYLHAIREVEDVIDALTGLGYSITKGAQ